MIKFLWLSINKLYYLKYFILHPTYEGSEGLYAINKIYIEYSNDDSTYTIHENYPVDTNWDYNNLDNQPLDITCRYFKI